MKPAMKAVAALLIAVGPAIADAEPCHDAVTDPPATPLHDVGIDAQRSACLRSELAAGLTAHALIDTPNFHGVLGGDLALAGRLVLGDHVEVGARARLVDYIFAQTAVTKASATRFGPLVLAAALGTAMSERSQVAVIALVEVPYTRDDTATIHTSGQLAAVVTGALAPRWLVHGRLGAIGAVAGSAGGETRRLALRAGADLAWRVRRSVAVTSGIDTEAGWNGGFGTLLVRAGLGLSPRGGAWRGQLGVGIPLGGDDATTAIVTLGLARDLD